MGRQKLGKVLVTRVVCKKRYIKLIKCIGFLTLFHQVSCLLQWYLYTLAKVDMTIWETFCLDAAMFIS